MVMVVMLTVIVVIMAMIDSKDTNECIVDVRKLGRTMVWRMWCLHDASRCGNVIYLRYFVANIQMKKK